MTRREDRGSFRNLQRQPEWPVSPPGHSYGGPWAAAPGASCTTRLLAGAVNLDQLPQPLEAVLTRT
jgi:hypothetical protein